MSSQSLNAMNKLISALTTQENQSKLCFPEFYQVIFNLSFTKQHIHHAFLNHHHKYTHSTSSSNESASSPTSSKQFLSLRSNILADKKLSSHLKDELIAWALSNGLTMGYPSATHAPFTLIPTCISKSEYFELCQLSPIFHKLVDGVARNEKFLIKFVESAANGDPSFTGRMLNLYKKQMSNKEKYFRQKYYLGVYRSDYMRDENTQKWGQIELNTIAASFGGLSDKVNTMHRFMLERYFAIGDETIDKEVNLNQTKEKKIIENKENKENDNDDKDDNIKFTPKETHINIAKSFATAARLVHPKKFRFCFFFVFVCDCNMIVKQT